jgi:nucleoside-triphosphatase THEP1
MIRKLSTGDQIPFSIRKQYLSDDWDEIYNYKDYSFSKRGLEYASLIINEISEKHISPVFLDEIGPLELEKKGFNSLLTSLLERETPLYLTIRESLLTQVINHFHMEAYEILNLR